MGNWSCLYHWFEFENKAEADKLYDWLEEGFEKYDWVDKSRSAMKFGFLNNRVIQAVTSEKWGLATDFTSFVFHNNRVKCAISSGENSSEHFQIFGIPAVFSLAWNYIFFPNDNVDFQNIVPNKLFNKFMVVEKFNRKALQFEELYCFSQPFFDHNSTDWEPLLEQVINLLSPYLKLNNTEGLHIVFGRKHNRFGDLNFGHLTFWDENEFYFGIDGCYNLLEKPKFCGKYLYPILDEPSL